MLSHLKGPIRKWQLAFALMALVLATWAWAARSTTLLGINTLLYFPVSQFFIAVSLGLATIGPTTGIAVRRTSRFYLYTMRVVVVFLAIGSLYVLKINIVRAKQAKQNQGIIQSPLVQAIERDDLQAMKRLIKSGESISSRDQLNMSPLDYACGSIPRVGHQPSGSIDAVALLMKSGADINDGGKYGRTPLMYAVRSNNPDLIQFLIKSGADVNRISRDGHSALFYAQLDGRAEVVSLLKGAGATTLGPGENSKQP